MMRTTQRHLCRCGAITVFAVSAGATLAAPPVDRNPAIVPLDPTRLVAESTAQLADRIEDAQASGANSKPDAAELTEQLEQAIESVYAALAERMPGVEPRNWMLLDFTSDRLSDEDWAIQQQVERAAIFGMTRDEYRRFTAEVAVALEEAGVDELLTEITNAPSWQTEVDIERPWTTPQPLRSEGLMAHSFWLAYRIRRAAATDDPQAIVRTTRQAIGFAENVLMRQPADWGARRAVSAVHGATERGVTIALLHGRIDAEACRDLIELLDDAPLQSATVRAWDTQLLRDAIQLRRFYEVLEEAGDPGVGLDFRGELFGPVAQEWDERVSRVFGKQTTASWWLSMFKQRRMLAIEEHGIAAASWPDINDEWRVFIERWRVLRLAAFCPHTRQENEDLVAEYPDLVAHLEGAQGAYRIGAGPLFNGLQSMNSLARVTRQVSAVRIMLALELHRLEMGGYPESLGDLSPRWLHTVPIDCITGKPFDFEVTDQPPEGPGRGYRLLPPPPDQAADRARTSRPFNELSDDYWLEPLHQ